MTTEDAIAALRRDVTAEQQRYAGAAAGLAQLEAQAAAARDDLRTEYGVETAAAARELQAGLNKELETEAAAVRRQLALAGGEQ
jgi:hypothetical protein